MLLYIKPRNVLLTSMEHLFSGVLYKGKASDNFDPIRTIPTWFAIDAETPKKYGSVVYKIEVKEPIKLLDITTWSFRNDFLDRINKYPEILRDDRIRNLKGIALMALGLPNYNTQVQLMQRYLQAMPPAYNDDNLFIDSCTYIGHRLSERTLDQKMVELLILLYGKEFQGYIQPTRVASCWMNDFAPEVCIFDLSKCHLAVSKEKTTKTWGGSIKKDVFYHKMNDSVLDNNYIKNIETLKHVFMKYDGYSDKEIKKEMPMLSERLQKRATSKQVFDIPEGFSMDIGKIKMAGGNIILRETYIKHRTHQNTDAAQ